MLFLPLARLTKLPAVNDIAIQDKLVAGVVLQEVDSFPDMRILDTQVNV